MAERGGEQMKNIRKLVIMVVLILFFAGITYAQFTASQIAKKYSSSVITVVTLDENGKPLSLGSGFFINTKGDIVTNHHVLEGISKAIIKTKNAEEGYVLEIIKDDPELDLLIARTSLRNTVPVPLGNSDAITIGEDIVVIGNPAGLEGTISKGIISGIRESEAIKIIQITAPISPGSSGGPVFNLSGRVIGITTALLKFGQNLNFAMPSNYLNSIKPISIKLGSLPKREIKERTTDEGRWNFYFSRDKWKLYYDKESISRKGKIAYVWTKISPIDKESIRLEKVEWQKERKKKDSSLEMDDYSNYEYDLKLYSIDCEERKWGVQKWISCGSNNEIISIFNFYSGYEWYHIIPLSETEKLYQAICR
jgi:hypothetical protein